MKDENTPYHVGYLLTEAVASFEVACRMLLTRATSVDVDVLAEIVTKAQQKDTLRVIGNRPINTPMSWDDWRYIYAGTMRRLLEMIDRK